jgi:hypothetical protein
MDQHTNQDLRAGGRDSALRAPLYGLAGSLMVGALVTGAPPGVRWGMLLIGYSLWVAARNVSVTVRRRGVKGATSLSAPARR